MRTRHALVTLVGLAVILLFALVVSASPPLVEPATFQDNSPTVDISLNTYNGVTEQGQPAAQYTFTNFQDVTCDINVGGPHSTAFNDPCYHRSEVYARGTTSPNLAGQCGLGSDRSFSKGDGVSRVIRYGQNLISQGLSCRPLHTEGLPDGFGQERGGYSDGRFRGHCATRSRTGAGAAHGYADGDTDRHTSANADRHADGDTDRHTSANADRHADGDTDRHADGNTHRYADGDARPTRRRPRRPTRRRPRRPTRRRPRRRRTTPRIRRKILRTP